MSSPPASFKIIPRERKGKILNRADFGCLSGISTINITNGCLFGCAYCYARGYSQAPPKGEVQVYANLPFLLKSELARKRKIPGWVAINTSSDCFQPDPAILDVTYETMEILLHNGIGISFLTKGEVPRRFIRLFEKFPDRILAQIGIVSLSDTYCKSFEPNVPRPALRLAGFQRLTKIGITAEIRMDPIIPFLTDTEDELTRYFGELAGAGVKGVTLSCLHLRPAIEEQLKKDLPPLHWKFIETCYQGQRWMEVGSSTRTKMLPRIIRQKGYQRIKKVAETFRISASICQCKNPDMAGDLCGSADVRQAIRENFAPQPALFRC